MNYFVMASALARMEGKATMAEIEKKHKAIQNIRKEITDSDRIEWLVKRVSYLEHHGKNGEPCLQIDRGAYWPQTVTESEKYDPDMVGLDLIDYIDEMIRSEA